MRRVIVTAAIGEKPWMKLGVERLRAYAELVDAELVVLTETTRSNPQHAIFDAFEMAEPGARYIWMDCDVLPAKHAVNLFEVCDPRFLWASVAWGRGFELMWKPWVRRRFPDIRDLRPYYNTGIVVFSADHARELMKYDEAWEPVGDQEPFNVMWRAAGIATRSLPKAWHVWARGALEDQKHSFFHCGGRKKLKKMRFVIRNADIVEPVE